MLDKALEALKTLDWGKNYKELGPLDDAIAATHGQADKRLDLENRLVALLKSDLTRAGKDYVCRKLMIIGTAACVPTLAALLADKDLSHMARFALERNSAPEAAAALRESVGKTSGAQKIGVISSLGNRRDGESVSVLAGLVNDADAAVARAAALSLGAIRSADAAKAVAGAKSSAPPVQSAVTDAALANAEALLAAGKKAEALAIYKGYAGESQPKHVRLAATRGMLACAGKKEA